MDFYLISPRVDGVKTETFLKRMFSEHIVMMGYRLDAPIGINFSNIKKGDLVLVALRQNWNFKYYFAGIVSDDASQNVENYQYRKLEHFIDLRNTRINFLERASFAYSQTIRAMYRIDPYKNPSVIDRLKQIIMIKEREVNMEEYINLLKSNFNLIINGAPGTGKTYLAKQIAKKMICKNSPASDNRIENQSGFVQFHPSYDYTDFIEGLRPIDDDKSSVFFQRKDGIFMDFCRRALKAYNEAVDKDEAPKFVFIIDEINRGDLSKIFGELFFSIDPGYRGEEGKVKTQYCNLWKEEDYFNNSVSFFIPENVYIIGTMNDIDRSVECMDFAMRRRFTFKEISAADSFDMIKNNDIFKDSYNDIEKRFMNLNNYILKIQGLSSAYQIGAAYFLKLENYLEEGKLTDYSWNCLWEYHLKGLLFEYLRGLPNANGELNKLEQAYYC